MISGKLDGNGFFLIGFNDLNGLEVGVYFIEYFFIVVGVSEIEDLLVQVERGISHNRLTGKDNFRLDSELGDEQREGASILDWGVGDEDEVEGLDLVFELEVGLEVEVVADPAVQQNPGFVADIKQVGTGAICIQG